MSRPRLLLVDDEPDILELLVLIFSDCETRTALNVESAKAVLSAHPIDVIITDIKMPGASGLALIEYTKNLWPNLPIIVITGHYSERPADDAVMNYRYIRKPFCKQTIRDAVKDALATRSADRAGLL